MVNIDAGAVLKQHPVYNGLRAHSLRAYPLKNPVQIIKP